MLKMDRKLQWSGKYKCLKRKNRVVIINLETGNWLRISKECHDIIEEAMAKNMTEEVLLECIQDEADRNYFKILLEKLRQLNILKQGEADEKAEDLKQIYFLLTDRCNLNCIHCSMNADQSKTEDYLNTNEIYTILDKIFDVNPRQIVLSGGEPLIRQDIYKILKYISESFKGLVTLMTNGILINENNIEKIIPYVDSIDISLDGIDEETCSKIRGKGIFEKVLNTVKLLHRHNFNRISLSMVIGDNNYDLIEKFYELNEKLGTKAIPRIFSPIGRGKQNKEKFNLSDNNIKLKPINLTQMKDKTSASICNACKKELCIDFRGDIYPCPILISQKYYLNNIKNIENIREWYQSKKIFQTTGYKQFENLNPERIEKCENCDVNIFCWTCLHFVDVYTENNEFDIRCKDKIEILHKIIWDEEI